MRSRLFLWLCLFAMCCFPLLAEENNTLGDYATRKYSVIPLAPEVASLMKYIDIPVSHLIICAVTIRFEP